MAVKLFVIDDDIVHQFTTSKMLELSNLDVEVDSFLNGKEAIEHISTNGELPNLIFLDINMPIMNGWEFLEQFEKKTSEERKPIQIFILSSSIDERDILKAKQNNLVSDYLVKPINIELIKTILQPYN